MTQASTSRLLDANDLFNLGENCQLSTCNSLDFLPFRCHCCHKTFCGSHFKPELHSCPNFDPVKADNRIPTCPLCHAAINIKDGQDPNIPMDQHLTNECTVLLPSGLAKKEKPKNCCQQRRCTTKLIVPITCAKCKLDYCAKHRFPDQHACSPRVLPIQLSTTAPVQKAGLAAIQRVRKTAKSALAKHALLPLSPAKKERVVITLDDSDDSDVEFVARHPAKPMASTQSQQPLAGSTSKTVEKDTQRSKSKFSMPKPATTSEKRAKAERASRLQALQDRERKNILTGQDKIDLATFRANQANGKEDSCAIV